MIKFFEVMVGICYRTDEGMRERVVVADYVKNRETDTLRDVVMAGRSFAEDRLSCLYGKGGLYEDEGAFIGSIKVCVKEVGPIVDGRIGSFGGVPFFEWKCDFPGVFEDWVRRLEDEKGIA